MGNQLVREEDFLGKEDMGALGSGKIEGISN